MFIDSDPPPHIVPDVYGLLTLTDDGRVIMANDNGPFETAGYGNWKKVKARGVKGRAMTFGFNPGPPFPAVTAELIFEGEFDGKSAEGEFHGRCEEGELDFEVKLYFAPDQNPFEDLPAPFGNEGTMYARRIPTD